MKIVPVSPDSFGSNCYLIVSGSEAFAVDPSASVQRILETAKHEGASLVGILLTHGHFDHIISLDTLRDRTGVPAYIHENDAIMLTDGKKNAFYDFFGRERVYRKAEITLTDGQMIPLGDGYVEVIHTKGHTGGSVCYRFGNTLVTGDTLFANNIGRCDLWSGDEEEMHKTLQRLNTLPDNTQIYPGHGESATLRDALSSVGIRKDL